MKNHSFLKYCTSILLIFIAVACTTGNKEQKIVTVTIQPQKYFAEKIQAIFDESMMLPAVPYGIAEKILKNYNEIIK